MQCITLIGSINNIYYCNEDSQQITRLSKTNFWVAFDQIHKGDLILFQQHPLEKYDF